MADTKAGKQGHGRTVEVDGITVHVPIDTEDDYELAALSSVISDPDASSEERGRAIARQYRLVLGKDYDHVMAELRKRNDGALPVRTVALFVNRVIRAVTPVKNS